MSKSLKLTDEELSRILSHAETGALDFADPSMCYAGAAWGGNYYVCDAPDKDYYRCKAISDAVQAANHCRRPLVGGRPFTAGMLPTAFTPRGASDALRAVRKAGLVK